MEASASRVGCASVKVAESGTCGRRALAQASGTPSHTWLGQCDGDGVSSPGGRPVLIARSPSRASRWILASAKQGGSMSRKQTSQSLAARLRDCKETAHQGAQLQARGCVCRFA